MSERWRDTYDHWKLDNADDIAERDEEAEERRRRDEDGPSDDEIYNRSFGSHRGVEGGIAYDTSDDEPGSLGENDWRL